jgi:hypothetical protein
MRSINIPIINVTVITDGTVITDEMIAIAETIGTMIGTVITTVTKSHESKATAMVYPRVHQTPNAVKATIHSDHTSGKTAMTATARVMETEANSNRSFVTHLYKATAKGTNVTAGTTDAVTMGDGETTEFRPGK